MLDLFGPTRDDVQRAVDEAHSNSLGLLIALLDKGVLTMEEFLACKAKAMSEIDQLRAGQREKETSDIEAQWPSLAKFMRQQSEE